ncbi:uncharacterized protein LOC105444212 [Strongylocentrotus purpuratus]|uniref:AIG1-type G domain-containing protein n=1 Tax=Strongylocentrotus purpuratus TaxID=7668 RepID=A0A7M7N9P8_STRPU|nr:uncharacterized protein LOC105444212 [Strongylocentrotus purpuratus]
MKLTDHVTTVDTRGIFDFSARRLSDVMAEISGTRGIAPNRRHRTEKIDCPIFVFKYSVVTGTLPCMEFLSILIDATKKRFGAYPIMVLTFGDSVADKDKILHEIILAGMPRSSVFFIENYTKDNHEMIKERHVALLKILEACILRADDNITFRWKRKQELTVCEKLKNVFS